MGEIKSVKVDNWGVFFLQKLQNFFNKTDYCDMTLQFNDNSQLKVHRLVLSACTDYFNLLESNCELIDDALVMPNDLQADVVVPIVNFMYTGTLEFELNMYNKLLRTARDMNMTVLLKLLEAHRRTMEQNSALTSKQTIVTTPVRGRTYSTATSLSPSKSVTLPRTTQPPATRISPNIGRRGVAPPQPLRGSVVIKEEANFESSPFEQLRQSGINYKRPASKTYETPPEKKPSIEDVKEFAEQQRMRKQLAAAETGISADDEYVESYMEDEFPQDDEEEDISGAQITIKQEPNQKPTIVFKASSDSKMDHAKIIGEVLKKYPHLIKNNKNLKLKIMPNSGPSQQQKIIVKTEEEVLPPKTIVQQQQVIKSAPVQVQAPAAIAKQTGQPKKIDSKTMHSLIALGAENTTGPWLCLRCGVNGRPISIPSYRGFRRHLINTHREKIDPKLCEHCGYRSSDVRDLHFHVQVDHQITSSAFTFPRCEYCSQCFMTNAILNKHIVESHTKNQHCIYCNEIYPKEHDLYNHMRIAHKKQAQNDGVIDYSDGEDENEFLKFNTVEDKKIKILSDISLPTTSVATNEGTKFVTADGSEMVLSDEQRDQLIAQLDPNQNPGGIIMVLNESFQLTEQQQIDESVVVGEQVQMVEQQQQPQEQHIELEKQDEESMFVYKEVDAEDDHRMEDDIEAEEMGDDIEQEDEHGHIKENEEQEKMNISSEFDEEQHDEVKKQSTVNISEDSKKLDEKLKMITGEWTDDEADEEHPQDQSEKPISSPAIPEESHSVMEKQDEIPTSTEEPGESESEEKSKTDHKDGLALPLKQELMEFLGIENLDESAEIDDKSAEEKAESKTIEDDQDDKDLEEQVKEEVEKALKEQQSLPDELVSKDELAQLREDMESNLTENKEDISLEEENREEMDNQSEKLTDSELQAQLESVENAEEKNDSVKIHTDDSVQSHTETNEPLTRAEEQKVEDEKKEGTSSENQETKDPVKSIITDWDDEGDAQDEDL